MTLLGGALKQCGSASDQRIYVSFQKSNSQIEKSDFFVRGTYMLCPLQLVDFSVQGGPLRLGLEAVSSLSAK